jgi:hypothetical protein
MEIVTVPMSDYAVDKACAVLCTDGLGPCIGIAVAYAGRFSLLHAPGPSVSTTGDEFVEALESAVPKAERAAIRPVIAGGKVSRGSKMAVMNERKWALRELRRLGFGVPREHWCPESADCQDLKLSANANAISVTTSGGPNAGRVDLPLN